MRFSLRKVPESFLNDAPWIFKSELELNIPINDCWKILQDDNAWKDWHPEVRGILWMTDERAAGTSRTVKFSDPVFNTLLAGPLKIWEDFDVWEDTDTMKRMSFHCPYMSRPNLLTYSALREEFCVVKTGENSCKFTRRVAVQPSFLTRRALGCIVYPRMKSILEVKSPMKFLELYNKKIDSTDKMVEEEITTRP
ncbi:hypothetical protein IV203_020015 [Nitzschia inconspicua]|uniref:Uncharacterized protein n=1 Tax=Nitzschia inconspicua TaxID=303405 RepID=A0A9K3M0X0_9STRA|nr:hypothetical protein IV203_020015 [Nitzschia inconspicua]